MKTVLATPEEEPRRGLLLAKIATLLRKAGALTHRKEKGSMNESCAFRFRYVSDTVIHGSCTGCGWEVDLKNVNWREVELEWRIFHLGGS